MFQRSPNYDCRGTRTIHPVDKYLTSHTHDRGRSMTTTKLLHPHDTPNAQVPDTVRPWPKPSYAYRDCHGTPNEQVPDVVIIETKPKRTGIRGVHARPSKRFFTRAILSTTPFKDDTACSVAHTSGRHKAHIYIYIYIYIWSLLLWQLQL